MKLLTVDLEAELPDVPPPTTGEQWVLVRLHREPLGLLTFPRTGCSAAALGALIHERFRDRIMRHQVADALAAGEPLPSEAAISRACPRQAPLDWPRVTVAVCTRNGATRLPECLDALVALEYPPERLDLMVVDNAPADATTQRLVEERYPRIRYVREPRPGLDLARNAAVAAAAGDIVAFTDDDVSVDPGWVAALARIFAAEPEVDAVTGLVVPDEIDVDSQRLFEEYGGFGRGFDRQYHRVDTASGERAARRHGGAGRFGTGANMAFRARVFERIGGFDPALDVGTPANGGGDLEMFFRVLKEGGTLVYEPAAILRHRHRRTYAALRTQLTNNGIGFSAYLVRTAAHYPDERLTVIRLGLWWFWWWNLRRFARSIVNPSVFPRDLVVAEMVGSIVGLRRYAPARSAAASEGRRP